MGNVAQVARSLVLRSRPDSELLDNALRGDALAFSEVYRRYEPRVRGFCMARLLSADGAQDATQEVFMRLLSAQPDSIQSLGPWLFGVARHVCIDVARRQIKQEMMVDSEATEPAVDSALTVEDQVLSKGDAAKIMLALRRVRARYRTALIMREIHQLPMGEIADALGVNEGAAYTVLSRARDAFGKAYAEVLDLPPGCAAAVEAMYRRTGSGLTSTENEQLEHHLASCPSCRREVKRASDRGGLNALVPFLPTLVPRGRGPIAQAMTRLGESLPTLQSAAPYTPLIEPSVMKAVSIALAGSLTVATGAAFVGGVASQAMREGRIRLGGRSAEIRSTEAGGGGSSAKDPLLVRTTANSQVRAVNTERVAFGGYQLGHAAGPTQAGAPGEAVAGGYGPGPGDADGPGGADGREPGSGSAKPVGTGDSRETPGSGGPGPSPSPSPSPGPGDPDPTPSPKPGAGTPAPAPSPSPSPGGGTPAPSPSPDPSGDAPGAGTPDPAPSPDPDGGPGPGTPAPSPDPGSGSGPKARP